MLELLKIIHFFSFSIAIGAGIANLVSMAALAGVPAEAMANIGRFRKMLGMLCTIGLGFLWATGIAMIMGLHGMSVFANTAFMWKMAAVILLTFISAMANFEMMRATMQGRPPNGERMRWLGIWGQIMAAAALILAIFAFT